VKSINEDNEDNYWLYSFVLFIHIYIYLIIYTYFIIGIADEIVNFDFVAW